MQLVKQFLVEEEGAEIAEYALLVVIVALGLLSASPVFQNALSTAFSRTGNRVSTNASGI
jgi:Flp pilus assembly pilin Flp